MLQLILSTGNIVSGGTPIVRKPGAYRSNHELTNSLRSNLIAAQQDYAEIETTGNGAANHQVNGDGAHGNAAHLALPSWTAQEDGVVYVPRIDWASSGLHEEPSQYEITAKLFFLPTAPVAPRAQYAKDALALVRKELGVPSIDLLIVSFPGMSFDGDCEWEADKLNATQGNDDDEVTTWHAIEELYREGSIKQVGIAAFGSEKLARFLPRTNIRPSVNQINIKNCCNVPPPLVQLAKEQDIELLVHSDCTDILPNGALRELLGPGSQSAGILADSKSGHGGLAGDLLPQWVIKYTAVVRDRGVIENKGYFASAELESS